MSGAGTGIGEATLPQDRLVDRRDFLARMGALGALAAVGGCAAGREGVTPAAAAPSPDGAGAFFGALPRPDLSAPGPTSPAEFTGWQAGALLRDGHVSATEIVEAQLARIRRWDEVYRAFNAVLDEAALARAREIDNGAGGGLLDGISIAVKDNYYTAGVPTTANSHIFRDFVPDFDATAVTRLKAAGGIPIGKMQMGPLATTRALTPDGEVTTVNAWTPGNPGVSPGGSSSGSATAVAARMAGTSIGTQTGGSITVPALAQGLTGLKPTMGRVSLYGIIPLTYTRDHPGPIARDARDAAMMLQVMAGQDPRDPRTHGLPPVPDYLTAATPVERGGDPVLRWDTRVGVLAGWADGDGEQAGQRRAFLREMERAGAELVEVSPSDRWRELASGTFNAVRLPERSEPFLEHLKDDVRLFGVSLSSWVQGLFLSGDEYLKGQRAKLALLQLTMDELLADCDVVVQTNHVPFDMIGLPLVAFPVGMQGEGAGERPRGILLGAGPFGEERLLSVVAAYQARSDWHLRRPADPTAEEEARLTGPGAASRGRLDVEQVAALSE
jgi:Asp-tRNA(Asn)/Glu-tRNA(Gln) amidotransferase A subunit family amidase